MKFYIYLNLSILIFCKSVSMCIYNTKSDTFFVFHYFNMCFKREFDILPALKGTWIPNIAIETFLIQLEQPMQINYTGITFSPVATK
jgi:hypothetical protein